MDKLGETIGREFQVRAESRAILHNLTSYVKIVQQVNAKLDKKGDG
jgi:hypothetical protein